MKKILLIISVLFSFISANAQYENIDRFFEGIKENGRLSIEVGGGRGFDECLGMFNISTTFGMDLGSYLFLGVGVEYAGGIIERYYYRSYSTYKEFDTSRVPLFINSKFNLSPRKETFFIDYRLGCDFLYPSLYQRIGVGYSFKHIGNTRHNFFCGVYADRTYDNDLILFGNIGIKL